MSSNRQLAAIMFADIAGYTALMQQDEQKALGLISRFKEVLEKISPEHQGKIIQYFGDGCLVAFDSSANCVKCALALQKSYHDTPYVPVRIGLHLGDVVFKNDNVFGDGVNIASRIESVSVPGAILLSKSIRDQIKNKSDFQLISLGLFDFKNVEERIEVFALTNDGLVVPQRKKLEGKLKNKNFQKRNLIVFLSVLVLTVGAILIYKTFLVKNDIAADKSIAVLPFVDMSAGKDQEYFSDGLSEELLNLLSKIPGLKVIGRTSSFSFKGKNEDLRTIGDKLDVAHILEGSVQKEGNKIRVTTQLIRTADGFHLWGEKYDRDLEGIFKLQDEIASAVVKQLKLRLLTTTNSTPSSSTNTEVYNLILQGNYFLEKRDKENLAKALDFYLKALAIDSMSARSWAALGHCYVLQLSWAQIDRKEGIQKARIAANKSVALDNTQAEGHYVLGLVRMWDYDWAEAEAAYQKVLDLEPGNPDALRSMGFLYRCLGRFDEAIQATKKSITFDPIKAATYFNFGQLLYHTNQFEEAIVSYKNVLELNPQFPRAHIFLGKVYLLQGKPQLALAEMQQEADEAWKIFGLILTYEALGRKKEVDKLLGEYIVKFKKDEMYQIAEIYAVRGDKDKAFEYLEKSYLAREARLTYLKGDPLLKNLEYDPRHSAFLKKMNLPLD